MKTLFKTIIFVILPFFSFAQRDTKAILGFEKLAKHKAPVDWEFWTPDSNAATLNIDSAIKFKGGNCLRISRNLDTPKGTPVCTYTIPNIYFGKNLEVTGYVKAELNTNSEAGIFIRLNDIDEQYLVGDFKKGNFDSAKKGWIKVSANIPNDLQFGEQIVFGGFLRGKGSVWVDELSFSVDGEPIENLQPLRPNMYPADQDSGFNIGSGIAEIALNPQKVAQLQKLGVLWGFLKYYHPAVGAGNINMDASLFRLLPNVLAANNDAETDKILQKWMFSLGSDSFPKRAEIRDTFRIKNEADFTFLLNEKHYPPEVKKQIQKLINQYSRIPNHYYQGFGRIKGYTIFKHENLYETCPYPDAGMRLLALFRYWNIIQYYFPYKHLIGEDWNAVLPTLIPDFVNAKNEEQYAAACLKTLARVHDSHASVLSYSSGVDSLKGNLCLPIKTSFIENKLVVTGFLNDDSGAKAQLKIGDIIEAIDGVAVAKIVAKNEQFIEASNRPRMLKLMSSYSGFLLRGKKKETLLTIRSNEIIKTITLGKCDFYSLNFEKSLIKFSEGKGFKILANNIGYIYPALLKDGDTTTLFNQFNKTNGLIIDLRSYPATFIPFVYGRWLKNAPSKFVSFAYSHPNKPGNFYYGDSYTNGENNPDYYKGKVIILVNEATQSQSEFTAMALRTAPKALIIGSQTSGADGNVTDIFLPGGIKSLMTSINILYPDGTETQRAGVKIDIEVEPTIKGIAEGRDELIEKAIQLIEKQ
ncbi:MAG: S41 family peptidase [Phycisphaerales bacterium]|nr:S41 family peptidase [Phycisphaerales bacterium]